MKNLNRAFWSILLAVLVVVGLAFHPAAAMAEEKEGLTKDTAALIGTWVVVGGEGSFYQENLNGHSLVILRNFQDDETNLYYYDRIITNRTWGHAQTEADNVITFMELNEELAAQKTNITIQYELDNAEECSQVLFEKYLRPTAIREINMDKLNELYRDTDQDQLVLHITGSMQESPVKKTKIDTTLTLEKVLPAFTADREVLSLVGAWTDALGNRWEFTQNPNSTDYVDLKLITEDGIEYVREHISAIAPESYFPPLVTSLDGDPNNYEVLTMKGVANDTDVFYIKVLSAVFDGDQVILITDAEDPLVLTPAA